MRWMVIPLLLAAFAPVASSATAASRDDDENYPVRDKEQIQRTLSFSGTGSRLLEVDNVFGAIQVAAYDGKTVEVSATRTLKARTKELLEIARKEVTLDVVEEPTRIELYVNGPFRDCDCDRERDRRRRSTAAGGASGGAAGSTAGAGAGAAADEDDATSRRSRRRGRNGDRGYQVQYDFVIKVPRAVAIDLRTVNNGDIHVDGTSGDFNVKNVNGAIDMANISGSGEAHTVNGPVTVVFRTNPTEPSSFKSINGELIVYFDSSLQADLSMKTMNGKFYSDFETSQLATLTPVSEQRNGKRTFRFDRGTQVRVGRGGPSHSFETLNGDIRILHRGR